VRGSLRLPALSPASPLQVAGMCVRSAARLWSGPTRQATVLEVAVGDRRVRGAERLMDQYRRCGGLKTTRCRPLSAQPVGWKPLRQIRGPPSRQSSLSASLSFSLIRGHSLGFAIGRHACIGRRPSGLNIDERPRQTRKASANELAPHRLELAPLTRGVTSARTRQELVHGWRYSPPEGQ
jgi:hypothetical protein